MEGEDLLSGEVRVRVLMITKSEHLRPAISFLQRRNYDVRLVANAFLAIKEAQGFRPHVVLLSWNSPKTNIGRMYDLFTKTLKSICIVFTENSGRKASNALMGSGIPHTMMAPITGPAIHMRIQTLLRKKTSVAPKKFRRSLRSSVPKIEVPIDSLDKLPSETIWQKDASVFKDDEATWTGKFTDQAGNTQTFHFKGSQAPTFNANNKSWENIDIKHLSEVKDDLGNLGNLFGTDEPELDDDLTQQTGTEDPAPDTTIFANFDLKSFESNQDDTVEEDDPLYNAQDPNAHDQGSATEATKLKKTQNASRLSILAYHTCWAVENIVKPNQGVKKPMGTINTVAVAIVETAAFRGYLVCNSSSGFSSLEIMEKTYEKLQKKMYDSHQPMKKVTTILELQCKPIDFMAWAEETAEFVVTSQEGESELAVAYVPVESIPEIVETTKEDLIKINLENDIVGDTTILFDVYIFMEKNQKYIMYLRKGSLFSQSRLDKLLSYGLTHIYLRKVELPLLHAYWASISLFQAA